MSFAAEAPTTAAAMRRGLPRSSLAQTGWLRAALCLAATAALWVIFHPYFGIIGDSSIYIGRALADLDPRGVGQDMAFLHDGQSRFSLFPSLLRPLVAALGAERASLLVASAGAACSFAAMAALARALAWSCPDAATGRSRADHAWLILAVLAVLPTTYGEIGVFRFGETAALPRPFAEAAVVGALAALINRRRLAAGLLLLVAALLHPIMAAAGVGAALVLSLLGAGRLRGASGRAALLAALPLGLLAAVAALVLQRCGVQPFARLLRPVDDVWYGWLVERSPHLFPTMWRSAAFSPVAAQLAAVAVAARSAAPRVRVILLAVATVAVAELAAAALFGDLLRVLAVVQMQLWRGTWLLAVTGGASLAMAAPGLWRDGPRGRLILLLLLPAWFAEIDPILAAAMAAAALALRFVPRPPAITDRHVALAALAAAPLLCLWYGALIASYLGLLRTKPAAMPLGYGIALRYGLHLVPILVGLAALAVLPARMRRAMPLLGGAAALLAALAILAFDQRPPYRVAMEEGRAPPAYAALVDARPAAAGAASGEVLWLDGDAEAWFLLHRPQWLSPQQAVGMVFSRELAAEWRSRADVLVSAGLIRRAVFTPWNVIAPDDRPRPTVAALATFCRRPDAPGTVVIPIRDDRPALDIPGAARWTMPSDFKLDGYAAIEWHEVTGFQAIRCAGWAPGAAARSR